MSEHIKFFPRYGQFWDYCSVCGLTTGDDCWMPRIVGPDFTCNNCIAAIKAAYEQKKYLILDKGNI